MQISTKTLELLPKKKKTLEVNDMELIVENDDITTSILEWNIHFLHHKSVKT